MQKSCTIYTIEAMVIGILIGIALSAMFCEKYIQWSTNVCVDLPRDMQHAQMILNQLELDRAEVKQKLMELKQQRQALQQLQLQLQLQPHPQPHPHSYKP